MERAGRVLGRMNLSKGGVTPEQMAASAWSVAVGKRLASKTKPLMLVRQKLVVEVQDAVWQRQLFTLRHQILDKLVPSLPTGLVTDLEFRIRVPRYEPQREESVVSAVAGQPTDEADGIADPFLRQLYIAARKKATA